MVADVIQADYEQLEAIAAVFAEHQSRVQRIVKALDADIDMLKRGGWIAQAADDFSSHMDGDVLPSIQRLSQSLGDASTTTRRLIEIFETADMDGSGNLGGADAGTGGGFFQGPGDPKFTIGLKGTLKQPWYDDETGLKVGLYGKYQQDLFRLGHMSADIDGTQLEFNALRSAVEVEGFFGVNPLTGELGAEIGGKIGFYGLESQITTPVGPGELTARTRLMAEAEASAGLTYNPKTGEFDAGVELRAFAGVEVETRYKVGNDIGSVEAKAAVQFGAGLTGVADVGFENGKFKFDLQGSAALGIGVKLGVDFEVDVGGAVDAASDAIDAGADLLEDAGNAILGWLS
jgi:WXG100 family type VII secretion target